MLNRLVEPIFPLLPLLFFSSLKQSLSNIGQLYYISNINEITVPLNRELKKYRVEEIRVSSKTASQIELSVTVLLNLRAQKLSNSVEEAIENEIREIIQITVSIFNDKF